MRAVRRRGRAKAPTLIAGCLGLVLVALPASAAPGTTNAPALTNLEHIYNQAPKPISGFAPGAYDLDFFTSTVPLRDYETGQLLDAAGNPLPPGKPAVLAPRDFAVAGFERRGATVYDITDPEHIQFVVKILCLYNGAGIALKQIAGRWILVYGPTDGHCAAPVYGGGGAHSLTVALFDVTDPYEYQRLYGIGVPDWAFVAVTFHPTKPYMWISKGTVLGYYSYLMVNWGTAPPNVDIWDLSDLADPLLAANFVVYESQNNIDFTPDGSRGYAISQHTLRIYDTTDPGDPQLISTSLNPGMSNSSSAGFNSLWRESTQRAIPTPNGSLLVVLNDGTGDLCPGQGVTFERTDGVFADRPVPVGSFVPLGVTPGQPPCSAGDGAVAPNSHVLVNGWFSGGLRVVDFSNPSFPQEIASAIMPDADVRVTKFYKGPYLYAADLHRGFDVFKWTGTGPAPWTTP